MPAFGKKHLSPHKAREKESHLEAARENIEVIRLYWRLLFDLKAISLGKHVETSSLIEDVSKQLALWQKYSRKKNNLPPESSVNQGAGECAE